LGIYVCGFSHWKLMFLCFPIRDWCFCYFLCLAIVEFSYYWVFVFYWILQRISKSFITLQNFILDNCSPIHHMDVIFALKILIIILSIAYLLSRFHCISWLIWFVNISNDWFSQIWSGLLMFLCSPLRIHGGVFVCIPY
jgi:hypothetical protein